MLEGFSRLNDSVILWYVGFKVPLSWRNKRPWGAPCVTYSSDTILSLIMQFTLEEERWDLVKGYGSLERICILTLGSSCTFCPVPELAGFSHSSLPSEQYLQAELWYWTSIFCSFYWPNLHVFKHKSVFSWYGYVFNKAECQAWQGNKGSNFAKWFLWFEAGCTCLDSPAHIEGGVRDAGWFYQFRHALLKQFKSWVIPYSFLFQKLFMYLLFWKVFGWVSV